jgi:ferredoxin
MNMMMKGISSLGLIVGGGFRIGSVSDRVGVVPRTRLSSLGGLRASSSSAAADEAATEKYGTEDDDAPKLLDVEYRGKTISVERGTLLRTALLRNRVSPHNGQAMYVNCRGLGTCGTCAVEVIGDVEPKKWNLHETARLNLPPHKYPGNLKLRLACQVRVDGNLTVVKYNNFFGQGTERLGPVSEADFKLPLGDLEFINDSPPKRKQKP